MRNGLFIVACMVLVSGQTMARHSSSQEWELYKRQHGKVYATSEEDAKRFGLFLAAREMISRHNSDPDASHKLGLSHLSDRTEDEFAAMNGLRYDAAEHARRLGVSVGHAYLRAMLDDSSPIPTEVDWRKVPNRVSHVKDQGICNSSWAFAAVGGLEGQQVAWTKSKTLTPLSEQDLVDCSELNIGCESGYISSAYFDIWRMGGIVSEGDYPYLAHNSICHFNHSKVVMTDSDSVDLPESDEHALKKFVARFGPVPSTLEVSKQLRHYSSGVFSDTVCSNNVNHGVLIVGYGTDPVQGDYWIVVSIEPLTAA